MRKTAGFTLIELTMAMAVFSGMLLIIVMGFINITHMRNRANALNAAQDNGRLAMEELVQAVRASSPDTNATTTGLLPTSKALCLTRSGTTEQVYFVDGGFLTVADGCVTRLNRRHLTTDKVAIVNFDPQVVVPTPGDKPQIEINLMVATNNGSTTGAGSATKCNPISSYCAVVTLNSGATPR
ncbi:type II secretion system protein [bacterium]|nr:MAG: type II secretion system protein [bacterium]